MTSDRTPVRTVVVCLPAHTDPQLLDDLATTTLAMHGITARGPIPHFRPRTRRGVGARRNRQLLHVWQNTAAGGPIRLLDLDAMRQQAQAAAATQWLIWHQVVSGTRQAQPFWVFDERHRDDPERYPSAKAQAQYLAQPRIQAMGVFNALPNRPCDLPRPALEAFQAGQSAFAMLAYLTAVPADGLATAARTQHGWLTPHTAQLEHQLAYLQAANAHLAGLPPDTTLVAMATTD
jgi:hypothetical protein